MGGTPRGGRDALLTAFTATPRPATPRAAITPGARQASASATVLSASLTGPQRAVIQCGTHGFSSDSRHLTPHSSAPVACCGRQLFQPTGSRPHPSHRTGPVSKSGEGRSSKAADPLGICQCSGLQRHDRNHGQDQLQGHQAAAACGVCNVEDACEYECVAREDTHCKLRDSRSCATRTVAKEESACMRLSERAEDLASELSVSLACTLAAVTASAPRRRQKRKPGGGRCRTPGRVPPHGTDGGDGLWAPATAFQAVLAPTTPLCDFERDCSSSHTTNSSTDPGFSC